ncbi:hypothetical protein P7C70_g1078, partial [Phenoliferia sp. Uapishka_3]
MMVALPMSPRASPRLGHSATFPLLPRPHHAPGQPTSRKRSLTVFGAVTVLILVFISVQSYSGNDVGLKSLKELEQTLARMGEGDLPLAAVGPATEEAGDAGEEEQIHPVHTEDGFAPMGAPWSEGEKVVSTQDDAEPVGEDVVVDDGVAEDALPVCNRTMLYHFGKKHGFGSEVAILLRTATIAKHYGYALLLDSDSWNYGPWTSYFEPLVLSCIPPDESTVRRRPMRFPSPTPADLHSSAAPSWTKSSHVAWYRDIEGLDNLVLKLWTNPSKIEELHEDDAKPKVTEGPLSPEETIPEAFWKIFGVEADAIKDIWRPNEDIRGLMKGLEARLGVASSKGDQVEGGDVTVAMHVRLGDKYMELDSILDPGSKEGHSSSHPAPSPGLHSSAITNYLTAARATVSRVLATSDVEEEDGGELDRTRADASWSGKPTLAIMSDDPDAWKDFEQNEDARGFKVVGTTGGDEELRRRGIEDEKPLKDGGGFNEITFNNLPLAQRIALTRTFVRDVSVLSTKSDGLVMSASSNVGRIMALLMGEEKALKQGRVRSVDTRWFPTARFQ